MEKKLFALKKLLSAVEKVTDEVALPQLKELLHKPDRKTLDRLSLLAGFQDWDSFQDALHGDVSANENYSIKKGSTEGWAFLSDWIYSAVATGRRFSLIRAALPVSLRR